MRKAILGVMALALLISCERGASADGTCDDGILNGNETGVDCGGDCAPCPTYDVEGHAQKGPFLNGSSVMITSLNSTLNQVGITYNTQILDNSGFFFSNGLNLASSYVALRADGFYFNEVCGEPSNAQITLNAVSDLNASPAVNINTLTHLEKARVEYLVANGASFSAAKERALKEILNVFSIDTSGVFPAPETMSIANSNASDAILIAITSILQGYRSESEFSDLMANLVTDLRTDGELNSLSLASSLMSHAKVLDTNSIRAHIENRYADLGISVNVPAFGKYIQNYLNYSTHKDEESIIEYPETGLNGTNFLNENDSVFKAMDFYSLTANRPNDCVSLKLVIQKLNGTCQYGCWFYSVSSVQNWNIGAYDQSTDTQVYVSTGLETDLQLGFEPGRYKLSIFLNDNPIANRVKEIVVN